MEGYDWAGVRFMPVFSHDAHFFRCPGLYAFVRRYDPDSRLMLYVDHADNIATAACPGGPRWSEAQALGFNELHVALQARARLDRLQLRSHLIRRVQPLMNVLDAATRSTPADGGAGLSPAPAPSEREGAPSERRAAVRAAAS